ncbi:hypothetical protein PR202_ga07515 [Eleusine coracana subsp. coracana]|uniref:Uncharacterized protein n=1 Tax=Eleusine coracana subsp. coracana TaxID=191504 RepID=A0AAV5C077_ELECO|nr:hypothetical protein PR202_ga07515 [Eleusine coracana subsp. coracana]
MFYITVIMQKIFLDATRELAKHTNDVVDEIWNYIKVGRLVQAGVLLFAAQEHIRLGPSCKKNGYSKPDGFAIIARRIINSFYTLDLKTGLNEKEHEQPDATVKHLSSALLLVNAISQAGGALHEYIRVHPKVPHMDVFERVSSILKDFGFCPPEEGIDIGNLSPYKCEHYEEFLDNLNFMNQDGQFPLHHAAETFSVPMIKLLISKGASANVRMAGDAVIQGLLPVHVAVEKTCLHKYLEDNLLLNRDHPSYSKTDIYNLIHLLCLPEMKIFLDATRELAKHTNDLIGEVCNYIKDGKFVHAGVLLFAAQEHIRLGSYCKKNGNSKTDGFATIVNWIADGFDTFDLEMVPNDRGLEQPYLYMNTSVQSQIPHVDVLEHVSAILMDFGFCPTEEGFNIGNICFPKCLPRELPEKHGGTLVYFLSRLNLLLLGSSGPDSSSFVHRFIDLLQPDDFLPSGIDINDFFPWNPCH